MVVEDKGTRPKNALNSGLGLIAVCPDQKKIVTMIFQYGVNTKPPKSGIRCGGEIDELLCFFFGNF